MGGRERGGGRVRSGCGRDTVAGMSTPSDPRTSPPANRRAAAGVLAAALLAFGPGACTGATKTGEKENAPKQPLTQPDPGKEPYAPPPPDAKPEPEPQPEVQPKPDPEPLPPPPT